MTSRTKRAGYGASIAVAIVALQLCVIVLSGSELAVRIVLPLTIAAVPSALWRYRDRLGVWVMFVGLAANLVVIIANGGLMPIERSSLVQAVGVQRANKHPDLVWLSGSKDVLVVPGHGRLVSLGDSIVFPLGGRGIVASPGDVVVATGLGLVAGESLLGAVRRRSDSTSARRDSSSSEHARRAA